MADFWSSAQQGFNRGVDYGADVYRQALTDARQAREDARRAKVEEERLKLAQRAQKLNEQLQKQRMAAMEQQRLRDAFEYLQAKKAAGQAGKPIPESELEVLESAYGDLPDGITPSQLERVAPALSARAAQRLKETPSRHYTINSGGGGGGTANESAFSGAVQDLYDLDNRIAEMEMGLSDLPPRERANAQKRLDALVSKRSTTMRQLTPAELQTYRENRPETDATEGRAFLPGVTPLGGSNRLQQALDYVRGGGARPAPSAPLQAHEPPTVDSPASGPLNGEPSGPLDVDALADPDTVLGAIFDEIELVD